MSASVAFPVGVGMPEPRFSDMKPVGKCHKSEGVKHSPNMKNEGRKEKLQQ